MALHLIPASPPFAPITDGATRFSATSAFLPGVRTSVPDAAPISQTVPKGGIAGTISNVTETGDGN